MRRNVFFFYLLNIFIYLLTHMHNTIIIIIIKKNLFTIKNIFPLSFSLADNTSLKCIIFFIYYNSNN